MNLFPTKRIQDRNIRKQALCFLSTTLIAVVTAGCVNNEYEIEMRPRGNELQRSLSGWSNGVREESDTPHAPLPSEERERLAKAYGTQPTESSDGKSVVSGFFSGELPNDIGGQGRFLRWETSLGSASFYLERFRGQDDLLGRLDLHFAAIDQIVDLLKDWVASHKAPQSDVETVLRFLETDLRHDLKNLFLLTWSLAAADGNGRAIESELPARALQYLLERHYIIEQEVPRYLRAIEQKDSDALLRLIVVGLNRKLDLVESDSIVRRLPPLANSALLESSIEPFIRSSDQYVTWREKSRSASADEDDTTPSDFVRSLFARAAPFFDLSSYDRLAVHLKLDNKPHTTNGNWTDQNKVEWSTSIGVFGEPARNILPSVFFAGWSTPNEKVQKQHFGCVALKDVELARYVVWHRALTKNEAREWNAFLDTIRPGNDIVGQVRAFRFTGEPDVFPEGKQPLSGLPAQWLETVLDGPSEL